LSMEPETHANSKPAIGSLVSGIINDAKDLFSQELRLAKKEFSEEIKKTTSAISAIAAGLFVLAVGVGLLLLMAVHLIEATTEIPLWGCYGIVGVVVAIIGIICLMVGKNRTRDVDFKPEETARAVKEDIGWIRARLTSIRIARGRDPLSLRR